MAEIPTRVLGDGTSVPVLGFGTYPLRGDDGVRAIASALEVGYRLIDTAVNYRNEREVSEAIRASGVDRGDVFVQTKVPGRDHRGARDCIETSLQVMGLEYLDSVLIHWPNPSQGAYVQAWQGLVEAQEAGLVRSIGVSNFHPHHLDAIGRSLGQPGQKLLWRIHLPVARNSVLTALLIVAAGGLDRWRDRIRTVMRDARLHRSPNAGWPESAMAAVSGLALGGPRVYRGDMADEPFMNDEGRKDTGPDDIDAALGVFWRAMTVLAVVAGVLAVLAG